MFGFALLLCRVTAFDAPAVAGVLIAAVGEGWLFVIHVCFWAAVLVSLLLLRAFRARRPGLGRNPWAIEARV